MFCEFLDGLCGHGHNFNRTTKVLLGVAVSAAILTASSFAKASTYNVNFQFAGTETVTGTIVTDCDSCFLQTSDVSSWSLTFSGTVVGSASSGPSNQSPAGISGNVLQATGGKLLYVFDLSGGSALFTDFASVAQLMFAFNVPQDSIRVQDSSFNFVVGSVTQPFQLGSEVVVSPTPLPAGLPLFATGLGALGLLGWRRKKKAVVVA